MEMEQKALPVTLPPSESFIQFRRPTEKDILLNRGDCTDVIGLSEA